MSINPLNWAEQSREFLSEVQVEIKKVTWPSQQDTIAGTVSVAAVVAVVSLGLFVVDSALAWIMSVFVS